MLIRVTNGYLLFPLLEKVSKRKILRKYRDLKSFDRLDAASRYKIQREELHRCLQYCKAKIPYYRDMFATRSFDIDRVRSDIRYLSDLPLLTKQLVRDNIDRLKTPDAQHPRKTGGSTGQSVLFYYDDEGLDWTAAINLVAYNMAGNYPHRPDCHISSELGIQPVHWKPKFLDWLKLYSQNRHRLMISSFSDDDLECNMEELARLRPYLLQGHPSSAYAMAEYVERRGLPPRTYCDVFEPSGEALTKKIVSSIERNLGASVVNRYGNAEFGVIAHSRYGDPYTRLKVFERAFVVDECEQESLVITGLTNMGMPLIRYDTGDMGTVRREDDGTYMYNLMGRVHEIVDIDGKPYATHFIMDYLDHKVMNVREFQILLKNDRNPLLNIVPEDENDTERIRQMLLERWPHGLDVGFIRFEELRKTGWRQKFRHIIDLRVAAS